MTQILPFAKPIKRRKRVELPKERVWVMIELSVNAERAKSFQLLERKVHELLEAKPRLFFPGLWLGDDFADRANLIPGYVLVEHLEINEYGNVEFGVRSQTLFKGVVRETESLDTAPAFITEQQYQDMATKVWTKLVPELEPGTYVEVQRGDWKKWKAFIEAVVGRRKMVLCSIRTAERRRKLLLPMECFALEQDDY